MRAAAFYKNDNRNGGDATSLYLVSSEKWQIEQESFTAYEKNQAEAQQFLAEKGQYCFLYNGDGLLSKIYLGLGEEKNAAMVLAEAAKKLPVGLYQFKEGLTYELALIWSLAQYTYQDYKKNALEPRVLVVTELRSEVLLTEANAIFLIRDLINRPPNDCGPEDLARELKALAENYEAKFEQWIGDDLLKSNFPAIHAVGRASAREPRLLSLSWGNPEHPHVSLIGKGVCFDSGGLDIKPAPHMRIMKKDMGGAAQILGLAYWVMHLKLPIYLQILIPAVENAVGPNAYRPGDILRMRNGLTVEIDNTDAEGRLILADTVAKAAEDKPELVMMFSTLTGAARVALGTDIPAFFTNDDTLAHKLDHISQNLKDPLWRLPLYAGYEPLIESTVADLCNCCASPYGGAITAALFLQHFVPQPITWVHFDLMGWNLTNKPGKPEGGEAMAFRTVAYYLQETYQ